MADLYCDSVQGDFTELDCGVESGRIIALGLVDPSYTFTDPGDDTEWTTNLGSSPQMAWKITKGVRGSMPRATETEAEGFGREATMITGADRQANLQVIGVKGNDAWVRMVNAKKWHVALPYSEGDMVYVDVPCTVRFEQAIEQDIKSAVIWDVVIKWTNYDIPLVHTTPASLNDESVSAT